MIDIEVRVPLS